MINNLKSECLSRQVLICQNRTCRKFGSQKILAAFLANSVPNVEVKGVGCLGQCGNGPMVLILPEEVWYWRVQLNEVPILIEQHLWQGNPVSAYLYPKFT